MMFALILLFAFLYHYSMIKSVAFGFFVGDIDFFVAFSSIAPILVHTVLLYYVSFSYSVHWLIQLFLNEKQ